MKLSDFNEEDYEIITPEKPSSNSLKLSDLNPEDYEVENGENVSPDLLSLLKSTGLGGAQGVSFGTADEIAGGAKALYKKATGEEGDLGALYDKYKEEIREDFRQAEKENPNAYLLGDILGSVGSTFLPGMGAARAANTVGKLTKIGALTGAGHGFGRSEADSALGLVGDTVAGGVGGGTLGFLGATVGPKAGSVIGAGLGYSSTDENDGLLTKILKTAAGTGIGYGMGKANAIRAAQTGEVLGPIDNLLSKVNTKDYKISKNASDVYNAYKAGESYHKESDIKRVKDFAEKAADDIIDAFRNTKKGSDEQYKAIYKAVGGEVDLDKFYPQLKETLENIKDNDTIKKNLINMIEEAAHGKVVAKEKFIPKQLTQKLSEEEKAQKALEKTIAQEAEKAKILGKDVEFSNIEDSIDPITGLPVKSFAQLKPSEEGAKATKGFARAFEESAEEAAPFTPIQKISYLTREEPEKLSLRRVKDMIQEVESIIQGADGSAKQELIAFKRQLQNIHDSGFPEEQLSKLKQQNKIHENLRTVADDILGFPSLLGGPESEKRIAGSKLANKLQNLSLDSDSSNVLKSLLRKFVSGAEKETDSIMSKLSPELANTITTNADEVARQQRLVNLMAGSDSLVVPGLPARENSLIKALGYKGIASAGKVAKWLSDLPGERLSRISTDLGNTPQAQKLAQILNSAAEKDKIGRNAIMFSIMQNPEYRKMLGITDK